MCLAALALILLGWVSLEELGREPTFVLTEELTIPLISFNVGHEETLWRHLPEWSFPLCSVRAKIRGSGVPTLMCEPGSSCTASRTAFPKLVPRGTGVPEKCYTREVRLYPCLQGS